MALSPQAIANADTNTNTLPWWVVRTDTETHTDYTFLQQAEKPEGEVDGPFATEKEAEQDAMIWYLADQDAEREQMQREMEQNEPSYH
jgi:hypothetical protein